MHLTRKVMHLLLFLLNASHCWTIISSS